MVWGGRKLKKEPHLERSKSGEDSDETKVKSVRRNNRGDTRGDAVRLSATMRTGRTIGGEREVLETASERIAAHKAIKKKQRQRMLATMLVFVALIGFVIIAVMSVFGENSGEGATDYTPTVTYSYEPTIEIVDEDAANTSDGITARMREYIGQAEADFRDLGYTPVRAVVPSGAIREVDFYLDGVPGFVKMVIDRGTGVSTEDADRMIRYLAGKGVETYQYIDVRIDGKAYWK